MHSEGFSFYFGGLGVDLCSLDAACVSATVGSPIGNPRAVPMGSAAKWSLLEVSHVV